MKKYNKPSTEIIKIATRTMVATSIEINRTTTVSASSAESRSNNSIWDDEEE